MNNTNIFALSQVIKAAGSDPSEVTDAIWSAGYRKPDRSTDDAVALTLEIISGCEGADLEWQEWPKNYTDVLKGELNEIVFPATTQEGFTAVSMAKKIISEGYFLKVPNVCQP